MLKLKKKISGKVAAGIIMWLKEKIDFAWNFLKLIFITARMASVLLLAQVSGSQHQQLQDRMIAVMKTTPLKPEDYVDSMYSFSYIYQFFHSRYIDLFCQAKLNDLAPNPTLQKLNGEVVSLLSAMKHNRPLVLNFGSCS